MKIKKYEQFANEKLNANKNIKSDIKIFFIIKSLTIKSIHVVTSRLLSEWRIMRNRISE